MTIVVAGQSVGGPFWSSLMATATDDGCYRPGRQIAIELTEFEPYPLLLSLMKALHLGLWALCLPSLSWAFGAHQQVFNAAVGMFPSHRRRCSRPLTVDPDAGTYDSGLFTPLEDLHVLSETQFTTLKHPAFPRHGVRIKKTRFCDETVK